MELTSSPKLIQTGPEWFEAGLAYRYQLPDGSGPYPTAILLHGRLGDEDVMWVFRKTIPKPWLVVAPRALYPDHGLFSWHFQESGEWADLADLDPAVTALVRFMGALTRLYNADPDRMYLLGFSQGAAVSIAIALREPALVRGVASLVGFAPDAPVEEIDGRLDGMPVFMAAGTEDKTVPYDQTLRAVEFIKRTGADLEYHEYRAGHKMPATGINDLRKWFLARR